MSEPSGSPPPPHSGPSPGPTAPSTTPPGAPPALVVAGVKVTGALVGAVLVALSAFFPWTSGILIRASAFDIAARFLVDRTALPGGLSLGVVMLALAGAGLAAAMTPPSAPRRLAAVAVAAVVALYVVQLQRNLGGALLGTAVANLGFGPVLAVGAAYLLWTGSASGTADRPHGIGGEPPGRTTDRLEGRR